MCLLSLYQYLLPDELDNVLGNRKKTKIKWQRHIESGSKFQIIRMQLTSLLIL